jgi:hypothetical protein
VVCGGAIRLKLYGKTSQRMELYIVRITTITGSVLVRTTPYYTLRDWLGAVEQESGGNAGRVLVTCSRTSRGRFPIDTVSHHPHVLTRTYENATCDGTCDKNGIPRQIKKQKNPTVYLSTTYVTVKRW